MKAIWTKFIPCTNFKGARVKAECEGGSITIPYSYSGNEHDEAAIALVRKMGWDERSYKPKQRTLISGGRPDGRGNVYVFAESNRVRVKVKRDKAGRQRAVIIPPCAASMGCLCAGHARDPRSSMCDTREA